MEEQKKKEFAKLLAQTGAFFFKEGLKLKDGRPSPYFINMGKFSSGKLSYTLGSFYADMIVQYGINKKTDILLGPSYKGSAIALATAIALWNKYGINLQFDYDRKEIKSHGEMTGKKGTMVNNALFDGCRIFILDDVITSMKTKYDFVDKVKTESTINGIKCEIVGIGIAVDREQSNIEEFTLNTGIPVYSILKVSELIRYLYEEKIPVLINNKWQPIDEKIKEKVDEYLRLYKAH
jgi:orotate phosphoribosyltransferase